MDQLRLQCAPFFHFAYEEFSVLAIQPWLDGFSKCRGILPVVVPQNSDPLTQS
ncbi:hypothetical protein D3C76_1781760 [compost metagenome]